MKRILSVLFLFTFFTQVGRAQSTPTTNPAVIYPVNDYDNHVRVLFGVTGGSVYANDYLALNTGVEVPFAKRFEFDGGYTFTPLEHKIALGLGTAQKYNVGGIIWVTKSLGINGSFIHSSYSVTRASKTGEDVLGGLTYRTYALGAPVRFGFDYVRQVNNHIACNTWNEAGACINGTEANYLQGGDFNMTVRMGAAGPFVIRMVMDVQAGHVLNQGNPQCDGTLGNGSQAKPPMNPCPRTGTSGGGASGGVVFEFPRHRGYEDSRF